MAGFILLSIFIMLAISLTIFAVVYHKKGKTISRETAYISDRDILLYLNSRSGNFSTPQELATHFGLPKSSMKRRISMLLHRLAIRQYGSGVTPNYTLRGPLPEHPSSHLSAELNLDLLKSLFEKYDYKISSAQIIYETGHSILDITKFLKPYMANKTIRRVQDIYSDRWYILATEYRNPTSTTDAISASEDKLELEVLEFARLHNGKITIEDLVREKHMERNEAKLTLEELQGRELLQLALDDLGRPEFILTSP